MKTLKLLETKIDNLAYNRAMAKIVKKKKMKTWDRVAKKLEQYTEEERQKIIKHIVGE